MMMGGVQRFLQNVILISIIQFICLSGAQGHNAPTETRGSRTVEMRVQFEVMEELPPGTLVGKIPTRPGFTYRFNEVLEEFRLNATSGEIRTAKVIDRESLIDGRFDFVVLSSQPQHPVEVRIIITDYNDNDPIFPKPEIEVNFSESANAGTLVFLDPAEDADEGINDVTMNYRIIDGNEDGHFRLDVTLNPSGEAPFLHLETTGRLDRETKASYRLNISAQDGGSPHRFGFLIVNIKCIDDNDSPPLFDHSDYVVSLNESVEIGTRVLQVTATDNDEGDNARITYYLSETETQFSVDPETGEISTTQHLNCQQNCPNHQPSCPKSCVFTVFARDHGVPRQDGRTYVTVNLLDSNDHAPEVRFRYFPPTVSAATVDENAQNGSVVAAISVVDFDEGLNGETTVSIVSGNELKHFRLESTPSFQLVRVNDVLDREKIGKYNLSIIVTDKGTPPRSSTAFLVIQVNDINDYEPNFERSEYAAVLRELVPVGSFVMSVTAKDEDTGINSQVSYSIVSGNEKLWFSIDPISGLITTASPLDRELQDTVRLKVSARDGGPNPKWSYTQVKITIQDENDQVPKFDEDQLNLKLSEDTSVGSLIATLSAYDYDQGTNGSISFHLSPETEDYYPGFFHLDSNTGEIFSRSKFDRETLAVFNVKVIAKDHGTPSLFSTANIHLSISDVNDNVPKIYPNHYFIPLNRETPINSNIVQVIAFDADEGKNSKLQFSIISGSSEFLAIDEETGIVTLKQELTLDKSIIQIGVSVKDGGGRKSEDDAIIEILIKSPKVEEIKFKNEIYNFVVTEEQGVSHSALAADEVKEIGRVDLAMVMAQPFQTDNLKYSILSGDINQTFTIDETNGVLRASRIDREIKNRYTLKILVRQGLAYGLCDVNISVRDLNDCHPHFQQKRARVFIDENAAPGTEIFQTLAIDPDEGNNSLISYSLTQNPNDMFTINPSSGLISLNKRLDFSSSELSNEIQIEVLAKDNGTPSLTAKQLISVDITDVNNFTPIFDHSSYETSLLESTPVNERFFALRATDRDKELNAQISYEIIEGNEGRVFGIFPDGFIYVQSALDREKQDYFSVTVMAKDAGTPSRSSTVSLVIHVIDENDSAPVFSNTTFTFVIDEGEGPDTYIGKLSATDEDVGRNAELTFSIATPQNDFIVGPKSGFIKTLRAFDREQLLQESGQDFISLEVIVRDSGQIPLQDTAQMLVYIRDVNDFRPEFLRNLYSSQISEGTPVGSQVVRVHANDLDDGLNGDIVYYFKQETGRSEDKVFKIDSMTGQITLARLLDRETQSQYTLTVVAKDLAEKNSLSSSTTVLIDVLDENDCAPQFSQSESEISIIETTPINKELIQFQATDLDLGLNQQVSLSITGGNRHDVFRIDSKSGILYLNKPLDYERFNRYNLVITASDMGNPKLSSSIDFLVKVTDYNDNPPTFPSTAIVRQVQEGIAINSPIVTVSTEDSDSGLNSHVRYSIADQEPSGPHFAINSEEGTIYTIKEIDREFTDTFRITVIATDQALPESLRLSSEKLVTVIVEDVNDCEPQFVSLNSAILLKSMEKGSEIIKILSIDDDSGSNGVVTYEMITGDNSLFNLDRNTGSLSLRRKLTDLQPRYQLTIRATDEAIQSQRKSAEFYLTIISVGDGNVEKTNLLTFSNSSYKAVIGENEPIGTSVISVSALQMDKSVQDSADIEYYITNITSKIGVSLERFFDVDLRRGVISTTRVIDREMGVTNFFLEIYAILVSSKGLHTVSAKVEIEILDMNDTPPKFEKTKIRLNVSESAPVGHQIAALIAKDEDTLGSILYSIIQGDIGTFNLNSKTGILSLTDALDRETTVEYTLIVRASDGAQFSDMTVIVQVIDSNDNVPRFLETFYSFDIPEDAPHGYKVGSIEAIDSDSGINGLVTYSVLSDWGNDAFSLNPQTGIFTLTTRLDYEAVQHYIFVVQAQDGGKPSLSSTTTVYFNCLDKNDNNPVFDPMSYNKEVYENVSIGTSIVTVSATDLDSGENGKISYQISSGDKNAFGISENGTIFTKMSLDRETKATYSLIIHASDHGDPILSSGVHVGIVLKDVNDEAPLFTSPNKTLLMENSPLSTVVLVVKAVDRDEGKNGYVEYILNNENSTFSIGSIDGLIRTTGPIDRERRQNYTLTVTARDRGEPPRSSIQKITVTIQDENDQSPEFDSRQFNAAILENSSVGISVLQVTASDLDEGVNSQLRYSIIAGDPNRDFTIGEDSGILRVGKSLNYERRTSYTLTIRVEDSGEKVRFDTCSIFITIINVNDCSPIFLDSPYLAYVRENMPTNSTAVLRVKAYDADATNQELRYLMKEGDKDTFKVNAATGEITVHRSLDRELQSQYRLTIIAMDTGTPRLTGTGMVQIIVQDDNDNYPRFTQNPFEFQILENTPPGVTVSQVVAEDIDSGLNAQIKYKLFGESPFTINDDTGEILTQGEIDREVQDVYLLTVTASDCNLVSPKSSSANVTIRVLDLNDHSPVFQSHRTSITVPDNTGVGSYILGASATDMDSGLHGKIRYYIGGQDADKFQINQNSGVVISLKSLKSTGKNTFHLEIHAIDSAIKDPMSSMINVEIHLANAKKFPRIKPGKRQFTFNEGTKNNFVTTIEAESGKLGRQLNSPVVNKPRRIREIPSSFNYYIGGGNFGNAFEIEEKTGKVKVSSSGLDYELAHDYELWIEVGSQDDPELRSVVALHVNITDSNDNKPEFDQNIYQLSVLEEEDWPKLITTLLASDRDSGDNGRLKYQFSRNTSESLGSLFGLEEDSGKLFTKVKLDREEIAQYILTVEAVDHGTPRLSGTATLVVNVEDTNDNPPRFTRLFSANISENAPIGTFLIQVTSLDKDVGENANCSYSFTGDTQMDKKFTIDSVSGNITVSGMLDRESKDEYQLKVAAIDGSWRAETLVTITIQDENDNNPIFEHSYYYFSIPESEQSVSFAGQVTASDRDKKGPNSMVSYGLKQPSDIFSINTVSGEIFSKKPLKYKRNLKKWSPENEYRLIVTASDSGKPPTSSECSVVINVVDSNNHQPAFDRSSYFIPVSQSFQKGTKVAQVRATDENDFGVNAELEYLDVSGNASSLFSIEKETGWIIVENTNLTQNKLKTYVMQVRAIDKGIPPQSADVQVVLVIVGPNLKSPVFTAVSYRVIVPENEILGTVIVTVTATDGDSEGGPNGQIRYNFSEGNEAGKFTIDSITGAVSISQDLDYDTKKEYNLKISAHDLGYQPLSSEAQLTVILTDSNDIVPSFPVPLYTGYIKENLPVGTKVLKLTAEDKDSPKFSIIHYTIVGGSGKSLFSIEQTTGIIVSKKVFDFEERRVYALEVVASNPDSNSYGTTQIKIFVQGVNEYFPKFVQPVFHFTVSEAASIESLVGNVQATDDDSGDDGIILFLFVGSSVDKGFTIDSASGRITVSKRLDRESQSRVVLTVLAKNIGPIRGNDTDEAQVIITIQDGNDPPIFESESYKVEISEAAQIGSRVGVVKATDIDVRPSNNRFSYEILDGNKNGTFRIDPISGVIFTTGKLDREKDPVYNVVVGAADVGDPPQTGTTLVTVKLTDVNDNFPTLSTVEGSIPENEPAESKVMTLHATDPDSPPNAGPFMYKLVGGPDMSKFRINPKSGLVTSTTSFDREITPILKIKIEIQDNGLPPIKNIQEVRINVTDKNDSPSSPRNAHIILYTFKDQVPTEKIATVEPTDSDTTGQYTCHLDRNEETFKIPASCNLFLKKLPPFPKQSLKITADDGKHAEVTSSFTVEFLSFDNATLENSVVLRVVQGVDPEKVMENVYPKLILFFKQIFRHTPYIYGLIPNSNGTDVLLAVRSGNNYEEVENVINTLLSHKSHISSLFDAEVIFNHSPCSATAQNTCHNGATCTHFLRAYPTPRIIESPLTILSSPTIKHEFSCQCSSGYTGLKCELKTEPCQPNPCGEKAICSKLGLDFQCTCPPYLQGKRCELERSNICESNPCKNGGSCQENRQDDSYFCLCKPGFFGNQCQTATDACRPNPCINGGECISSFSYSSAFPRCKCPIHYYGRYCEKSGFGFSLASYMEFPPLDPSTNDITIIFSTNKENSLLAYNFGEQTGGRSDFVAIQLVYGKATLSFGGTRTAVSTVSVNKYLADGQWYRAIAIRNSRVISLSVSECEDSGENCKDCLPEDDSCYVDDVGLTGTLNFNGNPLHIGGLKDVSAILERPGQVRTDDFIGCMHSIEINGRPLNLSSPLDSRSVSDTCGRVRNVCEALNHKCGPDGECIDRWDTYTCRCSGILADNCDEAFSSATFTPGSFLEFRIGEKYQRNQLLHNFYGNHEEIKQDLESDSKSVSLNFRTLSENGVLFYSATNKDYTIVELLNGKLKYSTRIGSNPPLEINVSDVDIIDGEWHNVKLTLQNQILQLFVNNEKRVEELNSESAHDFLDAYLTTLRLGGADGENIHADEMFDGFEGCMTNFSINDRLQPLRESGGLLETVVQFGTISRGCSWDMSAATTAPDAFSMGLTIVIAFFVFVLTVILVIFIKFRLRNREKSPLPSLPSASRQTPSQTDVVRSHIDSSESETIRNFVRNSKKLNESNLAYQKPDIIERTNQSMSHHITNNSSSGKKASNIGNGISVEPDVSELPEHYDLENASSIAPSDIDIVYHYKGFRDNLGSRNKSSPFGHSHHFPGSRQSPGIRQSLVSNVMKSTPLARLSPSSELSQQTTPRILTLQDISGKPLQSALLATSHSQKDVMSQSERSLNISPSSSRSSTVNAPCPGPKKKLKHCTVKSSSNNNNNNSNMRIGLTAEEIERLNHSRHKNNSSLVSTLDAVSSSDSNNGRKNKLSELLETNKEIMRRSRDTSSDGGESGNDSFTCSEFEYDNDKRNIRPPRMMFSKLAEVNNAEGDESFRGSLSTLVASDDDLAYISSYNKTGNSSERRSGEAWDYLLNWGPNYSPLASVFKDIAELPDSSNVGLVPDGPPSNSMNNLSTVSRNSRYPTPRPNEEYV